MISPVIFIFIKDKYWQTDFKMSSFHVNQTHALILSGFFSTAVYNFKLCEKLEKNMDTVQQHLSQWEPHYCSYWELEEILVF